jgi:hypothetical protein
MLTTRRVALCHALPPYLFWTVIVARQPAR